MAPSALAIQMFFGAVAVAHEDDLRAVGRVARLLVLAGAAGDAGRRAAGDRQGVEVAEDLEDDGPAIGGDVERDPGRLVGGEAERPGRDRAAATLVFAAALTALSFWAGVWAASDAPVSMASARIDPNRRRDIIGESPNPRRVKRYRVTRKERGHIRLDERY